ncbi:hypothetical protein AKJ09_00155 [Labilithrix luteola]|uniref:Lipoprotein n=1 Tax=Labilithrix luteola TaxID=1391654 RepID=A0A0K1PJB2_9BACT|nr:DUF4331 family protein [Labilithrix luteola]AKU93491.1 hypothetical protein AKJ09_00155 [Labilithrix luteola]
MKRIALTSIAFAAAVGLLSFAACSSNESTGGPEDAGFDARDTGPADTGPVDAGPPLPPNLGTQIDRVGRPAITTLLIAPFDDQDASVGAARDAYNAQQDPTKWVDSNRAEIEKNLAVFDALDKGVNGGDCGNQVLANLQIEGASRYAPLASMLADDRLWVNTSSSTCSQYMAVELAATQTLANTDCGGRTMPYDVIDFMYSVTSGTGLNGLGDQVGAVAAKTNGTTFPYLADPLQ